MSTEETEMKISNDRGESITLSGVLVGEVWFSSGQSNIGLGGGQKYVQ